MSTSSSATPTSSPSPTSTDATASPTDACGNNNNTITLLGLRIGSIFIIMLASMLGALFPILSRRTKWLTVPKPVFDFAKYFGSGVIIATAFIHLLSPALTELGSPCLTGTWQQYPWALALCMFSVFAIFFLELVAFRWGSSKLAAAGIMVTDTHGHGFGGTEAHDKATQSQSDVEKDGSHHAVALTGGVLDTAIAQIIGIAILEFGILLHSVLIGLTLAVSDRFKILFVVIVFHQSFEGLGLGSRLAFMALPPKYNWVPFVGGLLYGLTTPIGIAAGLGISSTYNPGSTKASVVSGVLDSLSSGILLYTGLVELLAHEFLFNPEMSQASNGRLAYALICMTAGAGIMALLGNWA